MALSPDAKDMAENMYRALWSLIICVVVTVVVSLVTKPRPVEELTGLVYGADGDSGRRAGAAVQEPLFWAAIVIVVFFVLNIIFW